MSIDKKGFDPEYDDNKKENQIYFHKVNTNEDGAKYRKAELLFSGGKTFLTKKNCDSISSAQQSFDIKSDIVLFETDTGQQKIHCWLLESSGNPGIYALHIARRISTGVYGSQEITLNTEGIIKLKSFIDNLRFADFNKSQLYKTALVEMPQQTIITADEFKKIVLDNITSVNDFEKIITIKQREIAIKRLRDIINGDFKNENDIQNFLKKNLWLFGNEYSLFVNDRMINNNNILDLIPENLDSYVDIIEVKLPTATLFNFDTSHNNHYCTADLTQAIAQTQNYIFELEQNVKENYEKNNLCKIIRPKGIVLFGSNKSLTDAESKYLRILNSAYHNLTIVTYQQLLNRAENSLKRTQHSDNPQDKQ